MTTAPSPPSIEVHNLTFRFPDYSTGLTDVQISLPAGSRTLLVGANGAGKTTLLRLLAGKRLAPPGSIRVAALDPFKEHLDGVTYLGLEWVLNPSVRTDIPVRDLLRSVGGDAFPARRDELVSVLDIDLAWRMHAVSDGERRRVQLAMGLIRPWRVLLLDEVTVDLDLLARCEFLDFLRRETLSRSCTVVYATHILDNLAQWPTHLVHLSQGRVKRWGPVEQLDLGGVPETGNSKLGEFVLGWLRADLKERGPRNGTSTEGRTYEVGGIGGYGQEETSRHI
jgi:CCR4-NOT complex subunit CAF16